MPVDPQLADRVRSALARVRQVEEKRMFGGLAFMVNGKMCINVSRGGLMCRIDPAQHDQAVQRPGWDTLTMRGKRLRGYVRVSGDTLAGGDDFDVCVAMALAFNKVSRPAKSTRAK